MSENLEKTENSEEAVKEEEAVRQEAAAKEGEGVKKANAKKKKGKKENAWQRFKVKHYALANLIDWAFVILCAVVIAFLLNSFIIINSVVPSGSMESTIMTGSRMIGFRLSYVTKDPGRGDIIIFKYPDDESQTFVKRIIGVGGDTVEIIGGVTYVNGEEIDEPYLNNEPNNADYGPYEVPEDCYFVMGDNRNNSLDARFWENTYVTRGQILAKAIFIYYPYSDIGLLE